MLRLSVIFLLFQVSTRADNVETTIEPFTYPPGGQIRGYLPLRFFSKGVELEIKNIITAFVKKDSIFFDIGMNAGYFTLHAAALGAQVMSFEPQVDCHTHMKKSLEQTGEGLNGHLRNRITLIHAGLSNHSSIMRIAQGACNPEFQTNWATTATAISWNVPILPTRVFQRIYPHINFLKIDTEGAEIPILDDLSHHFNYDHLVVELIPGAWSRYGVTIQRGLEVLTRLEKKSKGMYLLSDPEAFALNATKAKITGTDMNALVGWKIKDMIDDRLAKSSSSGCNVYFQFS